ncbi:DUF1707 domain-containing protein [Nocardia sp. NPDC050406]|uniref:DUF1707 domain-containing protein n=1 Tax=Nocardia sp. NPDC050406 TaxID=3364318 RepID=UPI0037B342E6
MAQARWRIPAYSGGQHDWFPVEAVEMTEFHPAKPEPPAVRVGTAEREQAATSLGEHFAAGRLDLAEYDERVARAYAAKTTVDLAELFVDLPQPVQPSAPPVRATRPLPNPILPIGILGVLLVAAGVAVAANIFPFFIFPVLFFLFMHRRRHLGPHFGQRYGT